MTDKSLFSAIMSLASKRLRLSLLLLAAAMLAFSLAACRNSEPPIPEPPSYVALNETGVTQQAPEADALSGQEAELTGAIIAQTRSQNSQNAPQTASGTLSETATGQADGVSETAPQYATGQEIIPVVTRQVVPEAQPGGDATPAGADATTVETVAADAAIGGEAALAAQKPAIPLAGLVLGPFNQIQYRLMASEARKYAKEQDGFSLEVTHAPASGDVQAQITAINTLTRKRAAVIALAPANPSSHELALAIKTAIENGAAVVMFDQPMSGETLAAAGLPADLPFVGPDNRAAAEQSAGQLTGALKSGAKVAIVEDESAGLPGSRASAERKQGFTQAIEKASLKLADSVTAGKNAEAAGESVRAMLKKHRDLQGILVTGPAAAYGAVLAVEEAKRENRVKVAAYGAGTELEELILEGRLLSTVDDFYQTWAVAALKKALENAAKPWELRNAGGFSTLPHVLITKNSLSGETVPAAPLE